MYEYQRFYKKDLEYMKFSHRRFVFVSVDKATSSYAKICKKFYIKKQLDELISTICFVKVNQSANEV